MLIERDWRVTMADVDAAGILYYASPLRWMEMLIGEWLERSGHAISAMLRAGEAIPVVGAEARYRSPLILDDHCRLGLSVLRIGTSSFTVRCAATGPRGGEAAVEVDVTHAFASHAAPQPGGGVAMAKQPLPPWLRQALEADLGQVPGDPRITASGGRTCEVTGER